MGWTTVKHRGDAVEADPIAGNLYNAATQILFGPWLAFPGPAADEGALLSTAQHDDFIEVNPDIGAGTGAKDYAWHRNVIYELTAAWAAVHTLTNQVAASSSFGSHTGLYHVRGTDDVYRIVGLAPAAAGAVVAVSRDLSTNTWTEVVGGAGVSDRSFNSALAWQGKLWAACASQVVVYDPAQGTISVSTVHPNTAHLFSQLYVVHGRLFWVGMDGTGLSTYEFLGGGWAFLFTLPQYVPGSGGHFAVASNGGTLNYWYQSDDGGTTKGVRFFYAAMGAPGVPGSFTLFPENTNTVVPDALAGDANFLHNEIQWRYKAGGFDRANSRIHVVSEITGGASPVVSQAVLYENNLGVGAKDRLIATHTFPNAGSPGGWLTPRLSTKDFSVPVTSDGSHEHVTDQASNGVARIVGVEDYSDGSTTDGLRISFFVTSTAGTAPGFKVRFWFLNPDTLGRGEAARERCTLVAPITGTDQFATPATLNGGLNQIENVTAEPIAGAPPPTIYTIVWDRAADGMPLDKWGRLRLDLFT
jgi:hypothetical protein